MKFIVLIALGISISDAARIQQASQVVAQMADKADVKAAHLQDAEAEEKQKKAEDAEAEATVGDQSLAAAAKEAEAEEAEAEATVGDQSLAAAAKEAEAEEKQKAEEAAAKATVGDQSQAAAARPFRQSSSGRCPGGRNVLMPKRYRLRRYHTRSSYIATDKGILYPKSLRACKKHCTRVRGCNFVSYRNDNDWCFLYKACDGNDGRGDYKRYQVPQFYSGSSGRCPGGRNVLMPNKYLLRHFHTRSSYIDTDKGIGYPKSLRACKKHCKRVRGCNFVSYRNDNHWCFLYKACDGNDGRGDYKRHQVRW